MKWMNFPLIIKYIDTNGTEHFLCHLQLYSTALVHFKSWFSFQLKQPCCPGQQYTKRKWSQSFRTPRPLSWPDPTPYTNLCKCKAVYTVVLSCSNRSISISSQITESLRKPDLKITCKNITKINLVWCNLFTGDSDWSLIIHQIPKQGCLSAAQRSRSRRIPVICRLLSK